MESLGGECDGTWARTRVAGRLANPFVVLPRLQWQRMVHKTLRCHDRAFDFSELGI